uniref:Uncharacterized protein n=1 Tax=Gadus morhua TaxID=8049 RepID=A0A8C5AQ80_GADMO
MVLTRYVQTHPSSHLHKLDHVGMVELFKDGNLLVYPLQGSFGLRHALWDFSSSRRRSSWWDGEERRMRGEEERRGENEERRGEEDRSGEDRT